MLAKTLMATIITACGVTDVPANPPSATDVSSPATAPPDEPDILAPDEIQAGQHFCCQSVDPNTPSGEGCQLVPKEYIAQCQKILYCEGNWTMDDGKVTCK